MDEGFTEGDNITFDDYDGSDEDIDDVSSFIRIPRSVP